MFLLSWIMKQWYPCQRMGFDTVVWYRPTLSVSWCRSEATCHGQPVYLYLCHPDPFCYLMFICVDHMCLSFRCIALHPPHHPSLFISVCVFHFYMTWCKIVTLTISLALVDFILLYSFVYFLTISCFYFCAHVLFYFTSLSLSSAHMPKTVC